MSAIDLLSLFRRELVMQMPEGGQGAFDFVVA
jgi:hypothetical protein